MKIYEFDKYYPNEEACKERFKQERMKQGVVCPKCGCTHHYWKASKEMFQCVKCGHRQSLKANTALHASKLSFRTWFIANHLLTATKNSISAYEMRRQLGLKRYQPVWEMMHKLRDVMGMRDETYTLMGEVEVDEAFFTTEIPQGQKGEKRKTGLGSQKKTKVLVMAESTPSLPKRKGQKPKKVGYIKMIVIPNLKANTIEGEMVNAISPDSIITTDASTSHKNFGKLFAKHIAQVVAPEDIGKVLPWVHIAIANAKTSFAGTYHGVKAQYLQEYLNEFCYKFNRRYFGENLFDRLLMISANQKTRFEHRIYNKNAA